MSVTRQPEAAVPAATASGTSPRASCPHGLRPGTTVCLHCMHDRRLAARARLYRMLARVGLGGIVGGLATALIIGAVSSLRGSNSPADAAPTVSQSAAVPAKPAPRAPAARARATTHAALAPRVAMGHTSLGDGMYVERSDDSLVVHFDTEDLRTRLDWKFEGVIRATLPVLFPQVQPALDSIPQATLAHGDLLNDLTQRGVRIDLGADGALTVWPMTRPGQDGPLVVAYRVTTSR